jgi:uncharacterized protein with PQ loop repeat
MPTRVFGWIAVSLSLIYKFPQIYKLYITKDVSGISVESQLVQASAYFFYITHGFVIDDPPIVFLGFTSLMQSLVLVGQYYWITRYYGEDKDKGKDLYKLKALNQDENKHAQDHCDSEEGVRIVECIKECKDVDIVDTVDIETREQDNSGCRRDIL